MNRHIPLLILWITLAFPLTVLPQEISLPIWPIKVTGEFGPRRHPITGRDGFHQGIDLRAKASAIRSVLQGKVTGTGYHRYLGNFVRISHGAVQSTYGHLSIILVEPGADVLAGQPIGISGRSGRATAEHLHFSLSYLGEQVHPLKFLFFLQSFRTQTIRP